MEIICVDKRTSDRLIVQFDMIEKKVTGICNSARDAGLKEWMDNQEVCGILRVSRKTLRVYREKRLLPFARVKNKFFHKPKDVQNMLESGYHSQERKP